MTEPADGHGTGDEICAAQPSEGVDAGRRDALRLATLAAALGAGLSVSFHAESASADGATQLQLKFYRRQQKGEAQLVYTTTLPQEGSKKLLEGDPSLLSWKCYAAKESLVGEGLMQLKVQAKQAAPAAPATGWDIKKNTKT